MLDSLSENPDELVRLEALVVLGFAHPDVMRKHQVPLHTEGRRLGVLLEKAGRPERAQEVFELFARWNRNRTFEIELAGVMRRSGKASDLIERYMERADSLMTAGKGEQALPWLQEVLALDRNRRDVTVKIRDIRHGVANKRTAKQSNRRFLVAFVVLASVFGALGYREWSVQQQFRAIELADQNNLTSIAQRIDALEDLKSRHRIWLGLGRLEREVEEPRAADAKIKSDALEAVQREQQALREQLDRAEFARLEGLQAVDRGEWALAIEKFESGWNPLPRAGSTARYCARTSKP
ncbi:MAG: hypothetical protein R3F17_16935 [Planctomycetota bacterium]